jgi:hypothetical protein
MKKSKILGRDKLEAMPTNRLVAYLKRINKCGDKPLPDWGFDYSETNPNPHLTKDMPEWQELHGAIKSILKNRENVK